MIRTAGPVFLLTGVLWLVYGLGSVGYDMTFALAWGEDLAGLDLPDLEGAAFPTPHPLANAFGLVVAPLGDAAALTATRLVTLGSFALLGLGAFRLGRALFSVPVGVVFAAILLTRPFLVEETLESFIDIPFLALVIWAAALEAERGRRGMPVLVLLALAGLLRPEAWVLSAAYAVFLFPRVGGRERAACLAVAASAPVLWLLVDLIATGDPLHSLSSTRELAERIERPRGLGTALELAPDYLERVLREPFVWAGLAGFLGSLALLYERALLPAAMLALGLIGFVVLGIADLPLLQRYLLVPATVLALFGAAGLAAWPLAERRARVPWALAALPFAVWIAASAGDTARGLDDARDGLGRRGQVQRELHELAGGREAKRLLDSCTPVAVPAGGLLGSMALLREQGTDNVVVSAVAPRRGSYVVPLTEKARNGYAVGRLAESTARSGPLRRAAGNASWALYASCRSEP